MGVGRSGASDDVDLTRDRALVELAQAGDMHAFSELYSRYFRRLVRFVARRVGDVHEAEEIAQEAFARAYRSLPGFAGDRRFYPWITVIASRLCVDSMRRQGRVEVGDISDRPVVEAGFDRLEREDDLAALEQAMSRLTARHREVLELRENHGWSYQTIADHYEVPIGTVEALIWRARRALRREFLTVCSGFVALPIIRRFAWGATSAGPGAVATLGSIGTVVALGVGSMAAAAPVTSIPSVASSALTAAAVAAPTAGPTTAGAAATAVATSTTALAHHRLTVGGVRTATPSTTANASSVLSPLTALGLVITSAVAADTRQMQIHTTAGNKGPVVGVNLGDALTHLLTELEGGIR